MRQGGGGLGDAGDDDRVGHAAERGGDRDLVPGPHGQPVGHRPEHAGQARAEDGGGTVDGGEPLRQGVAAGLPGGAVALGGALGLGELGDQPGRLGVGGDGVLVRGDERDVAVLLVGD